MMIWRVGSDEIRFGEIMYDMFKYDGGAAYNTIEIFIVCECSFSI